MSCDRERLSHYLDGELSPDEVGQLGAHLTTCQRCTADLATYRGQRDAIGRLPSPRSPGGLRRAVNQKIEARRRSRWGWAGGLSRPAVTFATGFTLVLGPLLISGGLRPATPPVLTAAFVVQEAPDSLEGLRIELEFDRGVAADSVSQAIRIHPSLPFSERVHDRRVELILQTPLQPGSVHHVLVENVRDERGAVQREPIVLNLTAGPTASLVQESPPVDPRPAGPPPSQLADSQWTLPALSSNHGDASLPKSAEAAPAGRADMRSFSTSASSLTAQPGRVGPTLPNGSPELRQRLGIAHGAERAVQMAEQAFQGGAMLVRGDTNQVVVLIRSSGRWLSFPNTWRSGEVLANAGARPPGTLEPLRGFGKVWRDQPAVKLQLGWPVYEERHATGAVQVFDQGSLVRSSYGVVYALFNDGTWRSLPEPRL
jgi:hypothetical protein